MSLIVKPSLNICPFVSFFPKIRSLFQKGLFLDINITMNSNSDDWLITPLEGAVISEVTVKDTKFAKVFCKNCINNRCILHFYLDLSLLE